MIINAKSYIISIVIALATGGISALITAKNMDLYSNITKPTLAPPSIVFPIVWTLLYTLMGISAAKIYNTANTAPQAKKSALFTYALSLIFNFFWSIFFFNNRQYLFAFIWLLVLIALVALTIKKYYKIDQLSAVLQIPYLIWVIFAGYLNFAIWYLN